MSYPTLYNLVRSNLRREEETLSDDDLLNRHQSLAYLLEQEGLPILLKETSVEIDEDAEFPVGFNFIDEGFVYVSGIYNSFGNSLSEITPSNTNDTREGLYRKVGNTIEFYNIVYSPITVRGYGRYTPSNENDDVVFNNNKDLILKGLMYYVSMWDSVDGIDPARLEEYKNAFEDVLKDAKREDVVTIIRR